MAKCLNDRIEASQFAILEDRHFDALNNRLRRGRLSLLQLALEIGIASAQFCRIIFLGAADQIGHALVDYLQVDVSQCGRFTTTTHLPGRRRTIERSPAANMDALDRLEEVG